MTPEAIVGIVAVSLTLLGMFATIIVYVSKISSQVGTISDTLAGHIEDDEKADKEIFHRLNEAEQKVAVLASHRPVYGHGRQ